MAMMNGYHILEMVGEGSFGLVYKCRKRFSKQVIIFGVDYRILHDTQEQSKGVFKRYLNIYNFPSSTKYYFAKLVFYFHLIIRL